MQVLAENTKLVIRDLLLNRRMQELNMTQDELAAEMGVTQPQVARMEKEGPHTVTTLIKAATALKMRLTIEPDMLEERATVEKMHEVFQPYDQFKTVETVLNKANIPVERLSNGLCKIHGVPLDDRGKCLQKGCKYA